MEKKIKKEFKESMKPLLKELYNPIREEIEKELGKEKLKHIKIDTVIKIKQLKKPTKRVTIKGVMFDYGETKNE